MTFIIVLLPNSWNPPPVIENFNCTLSQHSPLRRDIYKTTNLVDYVRFRFVRTAHTATLHQNLIMQILSIIMHKTPFISGLGDKDLLRSILTKEEIEAERK